MKPTEKKKEIKKPTAICMTPKLKEKVKKGANKEGRSFSDYACRVLDKHA